MPTVTVIIVNYRTPDMVVDCLRSLAGEIVASKIPCHVIVVENNSGDNSVARIEEEIEKNPLNSSIELLVLQENRGFAAGNNAALEKVLAGPGVPDYVWLLNPDTMVKPGALSSLVDFLETHPLIGIAGSGIENPDGTPQNSVFRFPSIMSEMDKGLRLGIFSKIFSRYMLAPPVDPRFHQCDWVSGASMLIRKEVFKTIGLFDDLYFLYYEETDFCLRAKRASLTTWYVPTSKVIHFAGQSTGMVVGKKILKRVPRYVLESRARYFCKNHGRIYRFFADLAWSSSYFIWRIRRVIERKPDPDPPYLLSDFVSFNFFNRYPPRRP